MTAFGDYYRGKTVLVTGHTGFKGSWLSAWLLRLGARVVGYALEPPSEPSHFAAARLARRLTDVRADVCDFAKLRETLEAHRPDVVFHLAAQALVRPSFEQPRRTFETNVMGTVNLLDAARQCPSVRAAVCITSDKCYENREWEWGYRETDRLGGHEPYGASKACAELAVAVFRDERFQRRTMPGRGVFPVSSVRAGNVIGGGDWARDRLVPDVVRAIAAGQDVVLRSPRAVRPWQHVLEAVSGYLWLGALMARHPEEYNSSYNFGPEATRGVPVEEVVRTVLGLWPGARSRVVVEADHSGAESGLLRLDCARAEARLGWRATWPLGETLRRIVAWYAAWYAEPGRDMWEVTGDQIDAYAADAARSGLAWAGR